MSNFVDVVLSENFELSILLLLGFNTTMYLIEVIFRYLTRIIFLNIKKLL